MHVNSRGRRAAAVGAVVTAGALVLGACGSGGSTGSATTADTIPVGDTAAVQPNIAAVIKGLDNPFFQTMKQGMDDQAKAAGVPVTVQAANSITDTTGQADKLNGLAGQDFSCYVVNPISGTNLIQGLARLSAMNKTIVNIDSPVDVAAARSANVKLATYIGTDNVEAGRMAGQRMAELLPGGGDVAVVGGIAGDVTSGARVEGFQQGVGAKLKVVQTVAANWERQTALTAATDVMRANPNLSGFFVANDDMGLGVARAVANAGKAGQVKVISVDGIKDALEAVKAGTLDGTVAQYPYAIGLMGIEACQAAAAGRSLPANVKAPVEMVTKENADQALATTPKPFGTYDDPFKTLIQ
ncbi:ribose transport system substrate-binding protein [Streptosporangium becharense]|uniref:Ribose transport system substrate-binding protein n=1 Tax=Streptosporangium becharense TaxID=1816182 RepID=A0A7W9MH85_9ACTN|nr:substrate-binding domain-containing protein [Streptosporangium becharense]MBB2912495.1 ribose transport system substrate-binding protein [Streptosporangium becharense]MBB5820675.1 ribose transport system substrate-binding protein [Streptosporangium becharense]